jgi:DNA-binding NarL/FixJ family response regulator
MSRPSVRVLVYCRAQLFRDGLCSMLEQSGAVGRVAGTGDWNTLADTLRQGEADTVIIEREGDVPERLIDHLFEIAPHARIVLVSSQDNRLAVFVQSSAEGSYRPQLIAAVAPPLEPGTTPS